MAGTIELDQDFREFIELLNVHNVRYLVIGGYAVAFHGHPRYTKDIDIWLELSPQNAERIIAALADFGFAPLGLVAEDFSKPDQIIQLGYPPSRVDLLTTIPGVDFAECYDARIEAKASGVVVNFIDIDDLKRNKLASGRPQDLVDVQRLS